MRTNRHTSQSKINPIFGRRSEPHTITISKGNKTRQFVITPLYMVSICVLVGTFMVAYLGATAYLVVRDDLIGAATARQARLQYQYEDRIAALRARIDLITSQQLLEQQVVETRVQELLTRQDALGSRTAEIGQAIHRASVSGLIPKNTPIPKIRPTRTRSSTHSSTGKSASLKLGGLRTTNSPFTSPLPGAEVSTLALAYQNQTDGIFAEVESSMQTVAAQQIATLQSLRSSAISKTRKIAGILRKFGVSVPTGPAKDIGGPFIEIDDSKPFQTYITALDVALLGLKEARAAISRLPIGSPTPGRSISSPYGRRIDPFKKRVAMHSGVDFRAPRGFPIQATGAGLVTVAGYNGGYGRMVEIIHGNGLVTRYAHMNSVDVKIGQQIEAGVIVGKVGSSGRSTGPHLHYEVRYKGKSQNPARYIHAETKLRSLL